jgi:thiamine biosynthesis protein ThiS
MAAQQKISVFVNGRARQIDGAQTIGELVDSCGVPRQMALIERNGQALLRDEWPGQALAHGDRLEIIRVVAGG